MLDLSRTRIEKNFEMPLLSSVVIGAEGLCLQQVMENGIGKVRPSNATADSIFAGISWGDRFAAPTTIPYVETVTVGADGKVRLSKLPTAAADMIVIKGSNYSGTALTFAATVDADTKWKLDTDGQTVITHTDNAASTLFVVYRYAPTVLEAQMRFGDVYPGPRGPNVVGSIGIIATGWVYTDQFDTAVNWGALDTNAEAILGGANGRFTTSGNGCSLSGLGFVVSAPSVNDPWLGLYIDR